MNASIAINQMPLNLPVFEKPQVLVKLQNKIDRMGLDYMNWQMEHPILNSLTKIAGGLLLVAALKSTPSHIDLSESAQHLSQGLNNILNNLQPLDVHAAGLGESLAQTNEGICGMPDTLTIHSGDTFYSVVRDAIKAQGITDSAEIKGYYQQIVEHNAQNIPDPAHVGAGTVVNIPEFAGCDASTLQSAAPATAVGEAVETLNTAVCTMPNQLTIDSGNTFYSIVRDAIKAQGITDPEQIKNYYQQIIAHNAVNIPDPSNVAAGTTVNIPNFEGCDIRQAIADGTNQGLTPAVGADPQTLMGGETQKTPQPDGNGTFGLVVMGAMALIVGGIGATAIARRRR